ncbi:MAG: sigma-70 family RNA polymerase sigma factor [Deltaproteobacteria bacterium]|nr:sigma-70 family RNA polymerase sigma factor [Deltaproteobacteria bacterium]
MLDTQDSWEKPATGGSEDLKRLFEANLELIDRISAKICRKYGYFGPDAEDFTSLVRVKFLDNDFARLRKFAGRSSLKTYITTVITRLFYDERTRRWGKFRPSQAARKGGEVALLLEVLLYRDGRPFNEAVRVLRQQYQVEETEAQLADLAATFPPRVPRLREGEQQLEELPIDGGVEDRVFDRDQEKVANQVKAALDRGMGLLPKEDQLILRMHFENGFTVAKISQVLGLEQRPLYARVKRCLRHLRLCLEKEGLGSEDALGLVGWDRGEENE